jgi:hypothetical protein
MLDRAFRESVSMRLGNLIWVTLAAFTLAWDAFLPEAFAQNDRNPRENTPADRAIEGARLDDIHLAMQDSYATLTRIVVVTPDCAFRGGTSVTQRRNVNKVGITQDMPFIGEFFAPTPRQGQLDAGNQLGLAYLDGSTLYVDLRPNGASRSSDRSFLGALYSSPAEPHRVNFAANGTAAPFVGFSVVNRSFQFQVPKTNFTAVSPAGTSCGKGAMARLPALAPLFAQAVGSAHLLKGQLIVLVKPSIIAGY